MRAAKAAGGGVVSLPAGRCVISGPIAWDSNISLQGAGMHTTTLVASADFSYDVKSVRPGADGRYVGMIWLDGPTETSPIENVTIRDIGFDPRNSTSVRPNHPGEFYMEPVVVAIRPIRHFTMRNVFFDLGYNDRSYLGISDGPKAFVGVNLKLNNVCDVPSYGLHFSNIEGHNGIGTIQIIGSVPPNHLCPNVQKSWDIVVDGEKDRVDGRYIDDDRIVIDGCVTECEIYDVTIRNVDTYVADGVSGGINAIKTSPSTRGRIHDVHIDGVTYHGSRTGPYGAPMRGTYRWNGSGGVVAILSNSEKGGYSYRYSVKNVTATDSLGMTVSLSHPPGENVQSTIENVSLMNTHSTGAALALPSMTDPTGRDDVSVSGVRMTSASDAFRRVITFSGSGGAGQLATVVLQYEGRSVQIGPVPIAPGETPAAVATRLAALVSGSQAVRGSNAFLLQAQSDGATLVVNARSGLAEPWRITTRASVSGSGMAVAPAGEQPLESPIGLYFLPSGGGGGHGVRGNVAVSDVTIDGFMTPLAVYSDASFGNVRLQHVIWNVGRPRVPASATLIDSSVNKAPGALLRL